MQTQSKHHLQHGSSLLEVLVAILIFSLGLLGMAGLSVTSIGYNKSAQIRNVAVMLVNSYAERARLNTAGFDAGNYTIAQSDSAPTSLAASKYESNANEAKNTIATYDKNAFLFNAAQRLPGGDAIVEMADDNEKGERAMDIWILWSEQDKTLREMINTDDNKKCPGTGSDTNNCMYFRVVL